MATNFGTLPFAVSFEAQTAFPLDKRSYFESLELAQAAAKSACEAGLADSTYYYGQVLTVFNTTDGSVSSFKIVRIDNPDWAEENAIALYAEAQETTVEQVNADITAGTLTIDDIRKSLGLKSQYCGSLVQTDGVVDLPKANGKETAGILKLHEGENYLNLDKGKLDSTGLIKYIDDQDDSHLSEAKSYTDTEIGKLKYEGGDAGDRKYVSKVTQENGVVRAEYADLPAAITPSSADGVVTNITADGVVEKGLITDKHVSKISFSKIDVQTDGEYDKDTNKLATVKTVQDAVGSVVHWRGVETDIPTQDVTIDGEKVTVVADGYAAGDIIIVGGVEYIASPYLETTYLQWQELGNETNYVTVATWNKDKNALTSAISGVQSSLDDHISSITSELESVAESLVKVNNNLLDIQSQLDDHEDRITELESFKDDAESRLLNAENSIDDHESRLTKAESNIDALSVLYNNTLLSVISDFNRVNSQLSSNAIAIQNNADNISTLQSATSTNATAIEGLNNFIGNLPEGAATNTVIGYIDETADEISKEYRKKTDLVVYTSSEDWEISNVLDDAEYTISYDDSSASFVISRNGDVVGSTAASVYDSTDTYIEGTGSETYFSDATWTATKVNVYTATDDTLAKTSEVISRVQNVTDYVPKFTNDGQLTDSGVKSSDIITDVKVNNTSLTKNNHSVNIPIATTTNLGVVKSSTTTNGVAVGTDGAMSVNSVSTDKLVDGIEILILDCGGASAQ